MHGERWLNVQHYIQYISASISVLANCYQLHLVAFKSPKTLAPYKYLIAYTSAFEIVYSFVDVITSACFYTHRSALIMFIDTQKSLFNPFIMTIFSDLFCGVVGGVLGLFSIQFVYRYLNAKRSRYLTTFKSPKIILWFLVPILSGLTWSIVFHFFANQNNLKDEYLRESLYKDLHIDVKDIVYYGIQIYSEDENGNRHIHLMSILVNVFQNISMLASFGVMLYCGISCYQEIQILSTVSTSKKTHSLQTQLFYALVVQTMIPISFLHLPIITVYIFVLLGKNLGIYSGVMTVTIAIYPAIDPIPNFIIIKDYRNTTICYINKLLLRNRNQNTESSSLQETKF